MGTSPMTTRSHKTVEVDLDILRAIVLNEVDGEVDDADVIVVDDADVVTVDEGALHQRSVELLK
jgi:hypothetical protein